MHSNVNVRLLWAEALDGDRTAIVIQHGDDFFGGVAVMTSMKCNVDFGFSSVTWINSDHPRIYMDLGFKFIWSRMVSSPREFREDREWEKEHRQLPTPPKMIEPPR